MPPKKVLRDLLISAVLLAVVCLLAGFLVGKLL